LTNSSGDKDFLDHQCRRVGTVLLRGAVLPRGLKRNSRRFRYPGLMVDPFEKKENDAFGMRDRKTVKGGI